MNESLLTEVVLSRQNVDGVDRQWYTSDNMELIIWKDSMSGELVCFHLCFVVNDQEMLFSWDSEHGSSYTSLRSDRENVLQYPQSPLVGILTVKVPEMLAYDFKSKTSDLDSGIADHILSEISSYQ